MGLHPWCRRGVERHGALAPSDTAQVVAAVGATGLGIGSAIASVVKAIALLTRARPAPAHTRVPAAPRAHGAEPSAPDPDAVADTGGTV
ncbi:hypothetical protein [Streptomyces gilvus]|uniref:hypothetical protein n=1 Tax=Streptomyces gilvus TaxID=2920937 RepID=UPI001F10C970|nr:hypothetical protein [Streptomyces sp. CME 23]MCH5675155.1 hypothetical protein [Streptomyces sp. CME 23]